MMRPYHRQSRRRSFEKTNCSSLEGNGLKQQMLDALIFSLAVYEPTPERVLAVLRQKYDLPVGFLDVLPWDELSSDMKPGPQPFLIGSSTHGHLVVACRGTADLADVVTDLKFVRKRLPFATGSAHVGFVQRAASINIEPFMRLLKSGNRIVFTGHSLGGAVTSLVALRVLEEAKRTGCCPHQSRIQVITFGAPLFADSGLAELINTEYREQFHHVVSKNDLVPKIMPLIAATHRLIGGGPRIMQMMTIIKGSLGYLERICNFPVFSTIMCLEAKIPSLVKFSLSIGLRLFWPGDSDHQCSFAGQIVILDKSEKVIDKAVRLTRAEEMNFWGSQLGFGLGLNLGGLAEHGLSNYYDSLAKGMSSRLLEYLEEGELTAEPEPPGRRSTEQLAEEWSEAKRLSRQHSIGFTGPYPVAEEEPQKNPSKPEKYKLMPAKSRRRIWRPSLDAESGWVTRRRSSQSGCLHCVKWTPTASNRSGSKVWSVWLELGSVVFKHVFFFDPFSMFFSLIRIVLVNPFF